MAVEIPVYVDIQGAFDRAAQAIPKEMPKLEKVLSNYALNMKIDYGGGQFKTVRNLLTDTTMDAKELEFALKRVRKAFDDAVAKGASKNKTSATVNNLAKAYSLLEQRVKGFYNSNTAASMRLEDTIAKVTFKIKDMKAQLASLTPGSDNFNKINYQLQIQRQRLVELTAQQMKYKAGIDASTSSFQKQAGIVKQLSGYFSGLYAAHTLIRFVKQVRDVTGELEYQRVALGHLLQDEAFGNELFAKTIEAAKESPFRIGQLVTYTKQLAAYRIEQENLFDTTQRLADISAGLGVDMNRLILAYGQVRAASVLRGQELRQFTEAGIPLVELLAEKFRELGREGTTTADVFKLISERAVPFEYIKEIFEELTNAGGQFYKMQETQAKTLQGRWEKLKDAYDQALMRVGETDTFQNMNDTVLGILNGLAKNLERVVRLVNSASIAWIAYWATTKSGLSYGVRLTAAFVKEYGAVNTLKFGVAGLTASFKKLFAVMKANWVGLAFAALGGLITWFTTFKKKSEEASESLSDMQKAIESMKVANERLNFEKGLISQFESISAVTDKTAVQSEQLSSAIEELKRAYPELADRIGDANTPLSEQVDLLRKAAENAHDLAVEEAKSRLDTQEQLIRGLEDELNAAKQSKEIAEMRKRQAEAAEASGPTMGITDMGEYYVEKSAKELKEETIAAAKAAKEADDAYEGVATKLADAKREAAQLRKLAFPEDAKKDMSEWQRLLSDARKYTSEGLTKEIFSEADIKSWDSLGEAIKKLKPQFKEAKETYEGLVSAVKEGGNLVRPELVKERDSAKDAFDAWSLLNALLGGLLTTKGSGGGSHQTDPFVTRMQERIKFMQDFKKGYDDLNKYMAKSGALGKESEIMLGRGMSLGLSAADQQKAAENLSEWYDDMINVVSERLKSKGVKGTSVTDLLGIDTTKRSKDIQDLQKLLQSLWDAKTDFDTSEMKKSMERALKKLSDEIKRSETARNFYRDILDLTGDEDLAANMSINVYGDIGREFKDRITKELNSALADFDDKGDISLFEKMKEALNAVDFDTILKYLDRFPEEWQKRLKEMSESNERYNADLIKNLLKTLEAAKTYGDKQVELAKQTAKRISDINALNAPQDVKDNLLRQNTKKEAEETARLQYEAFKDSPMYVELFADLDAASSKMLKSMRENLVKLKAQWKDLSPKDLKELQSRISEIDNQLATKNPFKALVNSIREYRELTKSQSRIDADTTAAGLSEYAELQKSLLEVAKKNYTFAVGKYKANSKEVIAAKEALDVQSEETDLAIEQANKAQETANSYRNAAQQIIVAAKAMSKFNENIDEALDGIGEIVKTFGSEETAETFDIISQGISKTLGGLATTASSAARLFAGDLTAIPGLIKGIGDSISGIFGTASKLKIKSIDKEIENQSRLIDDLSYSYSRLEYAMSKAFGAEYIYNYSKQLENLSAQADAYRAQADAEQSKGKKKDDDKVKEYLDSAQDVEDKIAEMRSQLSEYFAGTDITSAAEDFADAWVEAYKEFGSTTDAMSEKFNEMIQSMINRSLAAKIMQEMLQPIFDQIDTLAGDGLLTTDEIASIAALAQERIPLINDAMTNLMTSLASAGLDVRTSTAGFKGISKDIAGASEESILGLAAGINTQNFYMSYVPIISENVSQILASMTGGVSPTAPVETNEAGEVLPSVQRMVYDHLPNMDSNLSEILRLFKSVITTKSSSTNTNYVAVR